MDVCSEVFLRVRVCGLEEEDCLGGEEEGGDIEEGVRGEEDDGVDEDGGPDCGCELGRGGVSWFGGGEGERGGDERSRCLLGRLWRCLWGGGLVVVWSGGEGGGYIPRTKLN